MKYFVYSFNLLSSMHICLQLHAICTQFELKFSVSYIFSWCFYCQIISSQYHFLISSSILYYTILKYDFCMTSLQLISLVGSFKKIIFSFLYKVVFININPCFVSFLHHMLYLCPSLNLILMRHIDGKMHLGIPNLSYSGSSPIYCSSKLGLDINL